MKNMKKLVALLVAVVMVFAMTTVASAATVSNETDRTYNAYQIFSGTQAVGDAALGDVVWGNGINGAAFLAALKADTRFGEGDANIFANCADAAAVADVMDDYANNTEVAKAFANVAVAYVTATATVVAASTDVELAAGYYLIVDTSTDNQVQNPALLQVTNSDDLAITDKTAVPTVDKDIVGATVDDATDVNIGDVVKFVITGTLPSNYADYEVFNYMFTDTMSDGLTLVDPEGDDTNDIVVKIDGTEVAADITVKNNVITIDLGDLKENNAVTANSNVVVTYSATLDEDAVIGNPGNTNTVKLTYTNDPNWVPDPNEPTTPPTDDTPTDTVVVFTFEAIANKVDGEGEALEGAGFKLYKWDATAKEGAGDWVQVGDEITGKTTFEFEGLKDGTYKLEESTVPAGYNKAADVEFTITATYTEDGIETLTVDNTDFSIDLNTNGTVETDIVNQKGGVLPETGGIGTTIFYVVGGLLVAGALIVLVSKKRMSKEA